MDETIIATDCLCDALLKALPQTEDPQWQMNNAEVMTTAFTTALFFRGNHDSARAVLTQHGDIRHMLSKSRFSRRLPRLRDTFVRFFNMLGQIWEMLTTAAIYVIESFPIAVCDNMRIRRATLYTHEQFRGYIPSKKRYFYGLKIHVMVTKAGQPVAGFLTPGGFGDVAALKYDASELPDGAISDADRAYNDSEIEDLLKAVDHMQ
jgi:hypothetical protein